MSVSRLLVLVGSLLAAPLFGDSFNFTEDFTGNLDESGTLIAPLTTQKLTINVTGSMGDGNLSSFDANTGFFLSLGDFSLSASLGDDPTYTPGKTKATIKIIEPGYTASLGTVTLTWTATSYTAAVSLLTPFKDSATTALPGDVKSGAGTYSGNIGGSVLFGSASIDGSVAYTASTTVTGTQMTAKGSGSRDSIPPVIQVISPPNGSDVGSNLVTVVCRVTDNSDTPASTGVAEVLISVNGGEFASMRAGSDLGQWALDIPLQIGDNSLLIKARDANYNWAGPLASKITYAIPAVFTLLTEGQGRVSLVTNGQSLYINRAYTIIAAAINGHKFKQWETATNDINWTVTTNAVLTFTMRSNLVAKVTFSDTNWPVATITNLVASQRLSNAVFTVKGRATDNVGVTAVWYSLNNGDWTAAAGTAAWTADLALDARTNTVRVYALDAAGNRGLTNSVMFIFVRSDTMRMQIVGQGLLNPNYNGQMLELGVNYTTTATGTNGHKFKQWETATNGVDWTVTTNALLTFTMRSNLVAKASFIDTNRPVLIVSNLVALQRVTNSVYVVKGKATDNAGVSNVWYRLNASPWMSVPTVSAWSAALGLKNGTNLFAAYAEDMARNYSPTTSVSFICTATNFNRPPLAGTTLLSTWANQSAVITVSNLLSLCSDPDTNSLTISQINPSTNGATVVMADGVVTYNPVAFFSGMDRFSYSISDGLGGSATNDIVVDVYPTNRTLLLLTVTQGLPGRFSFTGFPGRHYLVQRAPSLQDPWTNLIEVVSDSSGVAVVEDTNATANAGFYRAMAP